MAKLKLPDALKQWKINSLLSSDGNFEIYNISKKNYDGAVINGILKYIKISGSDYNEETIEFFENEAKFLNSIANLSDCFNYIDIVINNEPSKEVFKFYIITEDLKTLADIIATKNFSENEIVDFGIQMSNILEILEAKNIFHGNIKPENIYITKDGKYKIGGFSDCESQVDDISFIAPEIYNKQNADFTTDIYSLGLIMYAMSNNNKLPFENSASNKDAAVKQRISGKPVVAPENGSEKLKSVIVIACQPINSNRWKNASNIKNALSSIKNELVKTNEKVNSAVIAPESTDFSDNVFEEFEYEQFEEPETTNIIEESSQNDTGFIVEEVTEADEIEANISKESPSNVIDFTKKENFDNDINITSFSTITNEDVFDNFDIDGKKDIKRTSSDRDYGDYFEDEPSPVKQPIEQTAEAENDSNDFDNDSFDSNDYSEEGKSKTSIVVIIVAIIVILAALGFTAYCIFNGIFSADKNNSPTSPSSTQFVATTAQATTQPTTPQPTTVQPTTVVEYKTVANVLGYTYNEAKEILEKDGFNIEIGDYQYSYYYEEGYIIYQSPEGNSTAESGNTVYVTISSGLIIEETEPETEASPAPAVSNGDYLLQNSDSSYLSYSQISSLSNSELQLAINEIYARRGRIFADASLNAYFNSKSWYVGKYTAEDFDKYVKFNSYEQQNLKLLIDERAAR